MVEAGLPLWKRIGLCNKDINMVMQFGTWNVRTLLQAGNTNIIMEETERYKMDIEEELQIMGVRRWIKQCEERAE